MSKQRVLVVDDHPTNRLKLELAIKNLDIKAHSVADGRKALEALEAGGYDLVLLDLVMPEMDGYQVLDAIKSSTWLRGIPVIVISTVDDLESIARAIKLGAEDYLPKTFDRTIFEARVLASLEKKRFRDLEAEYVRSIEVEKSRADAILRATLPDAVVQELKETRQVRPRRFEDVAVLFSDVAGFTRFCDTESPEVVAAHLQELVLTFEEITERHGLEKIKTVGDAFLATSGMLTAIPDHIGAAIRCGLEMVEAAPRLSAGWQVHVGVHLGSVVAGIIGHRQYLFDIWGDTVNIAARITDHAGPGKVLASNTAWRKVGGDLNGVLIGTVELKGKGGIELIECRKQTG